MFWKGAPSCRSATTSFTGNPPGGACRGQPGFTLAAKRDGRYEVSLQGRFLPGWLGEFSAGLADHRLSILTGSARRISPSVWQACFELDASAAGMKLDHIDFLALASSRSAAKGVAPALEAVRVVEEEDALLVEVNGADQIGFLAGLLKRFAFYSLFPVELEVATAGGQISDRIRLKGVGGTSPSAEAVDALRKGLQELAGKPRQEPLGHNRGRRSKLASAAQSSPPVSPAAAEFFLATSRPNNSLLKIDPSTRPAAAPGTDAFNAPRKGAEP